MRPFHCTLVGLTAAVITNVDNSGALIMIVGDCVRAFLLSSFPHFMSQKDVLCTSKKYFFETYIIYLF